jgi:hypothetical protein
MSSCSNLDEARHVLKLSYGLTVTLLIDEATGTNRCEWFERPTKAMLPRIAKEYVPWRNEIVEAWARRNGKRVLLVDL